MDFVHFSKSNVTEISEMSALRPLLEIGNSIVNIFTCKKKLHVEKMKNVIFRLCIFVKTRNSDRNRQANALETSKIRLRWVSDSLDFFFACRIVWSNSVLQEIAIWSAIFEISLTFDPKSAFQIFSWFWEILFQIWSYCWTYYTRGERPAFGRFSELSWALVSVNLTLRNFEISWRPTLETHEKPSHEHFQLLEQPQTLPKSSRFDPRAARFAINLAR